MKCLRLLPLCMLVLLPNVLSSQERGSIYDDPEAYEVYSAALPLDSSYRDSKTVLILRSIPPKEWPIGQPRGAILGDSEFNRTFSPVFDSFEKANQESRSLEHHFSIPKPYSLVSQDEIDAAFQRRLPNTVDDGWSGFRGAFPESRGYLILSGVGFNSDRTLALVYVEHMCGGLCGAARYYILQKRKGHWVEYKPKGVVEVTGTS
jgi:hypothetical protein